MTIEELTAAKDYVERAYAILKSAESVLSDDAFDLIVQLRNQITELMLSDYIKCGLASVKYEAKDINGVKHFIVRVA